MAVFYSDNLAAAAAGPYDPNFLANSARSHARSRFRVAKIALDSTALNDTAAIAKFKSSDRIYDIVVDNIHGIPSTGEYELGVAESDYDHVVGNAPMIDDDLFGSGTSLKVATGSLSVFKSGGLDDVDRGLQLWELVNVLTPATYAEDPKIDMDLVMTFSEALDTPQTTAFRISYVAFG